MFYDLYFCPSSLGGSVLARYGNDSHKFLSGDVGILVRAGWEKRDPTFALVVAIHRAREKGLTP